MATNDLNNKKGFFGRVSSFIKKNVPILAGIKYHPQSLEELKKLVNDPLVKLSQIDVSHVDSFENLFKNSKRTDFSGIEKWDTSHVKNMKKMFYNCKNFNADISKWNVSNVTSMSMMFSGAKNFNQDLSSWDMSGMKGRLNGKFLGNMFRFADKMNKRIFDRYHELENKNVPVEERFNYLPIPKPRDFKKYIVPANFSNDTKEILELSDDYQNVDTSATESLNDVLKNSKKEKYTNFDKLDFSNVKTADNFLSNAKYFNENIPDLNSLNYSNNMLDGAESFQKDVPQMPNVKQMNGFLDNVDYKGNLHDSMENASPVSAVKSFDKTSDEHLRNELKNVKSDNAVKLNFIAKTILPYIENGKRWSSNNNVPDSRIEYEKFIKKVDPNDEYMIFCVSSENRKKIESVCPGLLNAPLQENGYDNYKGGLRCNSYLVSKSDYKKLLDSNIKLYNPYTRKEDSIENSSVSFSFEKYNANFGAHGRTVFENYSEYSNHISRGNLGRSGDYSIESNFPLLKAIETSDDYENKQKNMDKYLSTIIEKINSISRNNPLAAKLCVDIVKNYKAPNDLDRNYFKNRNLNVSFGDNIPRIKELLINGIDNNSLKTSITYADNKMITDALSLKECLRDINEVLSQRERNYRADNIYSLLTTGHLFTANDCDYFNDISIKPILPLLNAMEKASESEIEQLNTNVNIFDFKDESKLLCKRDLNLQQQKENTTVKENKNTNSVIENKKDLSKSFKKSR